MTIDECIKRDIERLVYDLRYNQGIITDETKITVLNEYWDDEGFYNLILETTLETPCQYRSHTRIPIENISTEN